MMEEENSIAIIFSLCGLGLVYGIYNMIKVLTVSPMVINQKQKGEDDESLIQEGGAVVLNQQQVDKLKKISDLISDGAQIFIYYEYLCIMLFVLLFGTLIFFTAEHIPGTAFTTVAFVIGAFTSMICGYIGMKIATAANYRTAYKAQYVN